MSENTMTGPDVEEVARELRHTEATFKALRAEWAEKLLQTPVMDVATREKYFHMIRALDEVRMVMLLRVQTAQMTLLAAENEVAGN